MSTVTLSTFTKTPKAVHAGLNAIVAKYVSGSVGILTAGSIIKIAKIPDRAVIMGGFVKKAVATQDVLLNLCYQSSTASTTVLCKLASASLSGTTDIGIDGAGVLATDPIGYQISISDGQAVRHAVLQASALSASLSISVTFRLDYVMDHAP